MLCCALDASIGISSETDGRLLSGLRKEVSRHVGPAERRLRRGTDPYDLVFLAIDLQCAASSMRLPPYRGNSMSLRVWIALGPGEHRSMTRVRGCPQNCMRVGAQLRGRHTGIRSEIFFL